MTRDREELLSAYLDGELGEAEMAQVEAMLAGDPSLADELERLSSNDRLLGAALRAQISDDVDEATARRFGLHDEHPAAANDDWPWQRWLGAGGVAVAAAALLLVIRPGPSEPWTGDRFDQVMSGTASMQQASLGDNATLTPLLSFRAADGRYCREFRLAAKDPAQRRDGIACREGTEWKTVALVAAQPELADPNRIIVAGGNERADLDKAYAKLGADAPVTADEERALIANGWTEQESPSSGE